MSVGIQHAVNSLMVISQEIKNKRGELKELSERKKQLEGEIKTFLQQQNMKAVTYNGVTISLNEKDRAKKVSKNQKKNQMIQTLQKYGVRPSDDMMNELFQNETLRQEFIAVAPSDGRRD